LNGEVSQSEQEYILTLLIRIIRGGILILKTLIGIGESIMKYLLTPSSLALLHPHSPKTNNN
jgi:hypothetical protein